MPDTQPLRHSLLCQLSSLQQIAQGLLLRDQFSRAIVNALAALGAEFAPPSCRG